MGIRYQKGENLLFSLARVVTRKEAFSPMSGIRKSVIVHPVVVALGLMAQNNKGLDLFSVNCS